MVRSLFWPGTPSTYAGYVCWRGFVSEAECPAALRQFIGNRFTLYQVLCTLCVCCASGCMANASEPAQVFRQQGHGRPSHLPFSHPTKA